VRLTNESANEHSVILKGKKMKGPTFSQVRNIAVCHIVQALNSDSQQIDIDAINDEQWEKLQNAEVVVLIYERNEWTEEAIIYLQVLGCDDLPIYEESEEEYDEIN